MPALTFFNLSVAFLAAALLHVGGLAGLAYLILPQTIRMEPILKVSLAPPPPAASAPQPPDSQPRTPVLPVRMDAPRLIEESQVPDMKALEALTAPQFGLAGMGVVGGVPGGSLHGIVAQLVQGIPRVAPPPTAPPPPPAEAGEPMQVQIPGAVQKARLINEVVPEYPPIARQSRIQGLVRLEIIVSADGSVSQIKLLTGHPLLAKAAIQAVQQWMFQPTMLRGKPVEVRSVIDVNFRLEGIFR